MVNWRRVKEETQSLSLSLFLFCIPKGDFASPGESQNLHISQPRSLSTWFRSAVCSLGIWLPEIAGFICKIKIHIYHILSQPAFFHGKTMVTTCHFHPFPWDFFGFNRRKPHIFHHFSPKNILLPVHPPPVEPDLLQHVLPESPAQRRFVQRLIKHGQRVARRGVPEEVHLQSVVPRCRLMGMMHISGFFGD